MNSSRPERECHAQPLAHSAVGMVTMCPCCGQVHLNLEYLTLRFEPEAFDELARLLAHAQHRMAALQAPAAGGEHADPIH